MFLRQTDRRQTAMATTCPMPVRSPRIPIGSLPVFARQDRALGAVSPTNSHAALNELAARGTLRRRLDAEAPTHFAAPTGHRRVAIDYEAEAGPDASRSACRSCSASPQHPTHRGRARAAGARTALARRTRPVQITRDLPGFWRGSYAAVRTEMRGRYPRHPVAGRSARRAADAARQAARDLIHSAHDATPKLIGVDWGTSNCRAFRIGARRFRAPRPVNERDRHPRGRARRFRRRVPDPMLGDWLAPVHAAPVLMSGMIGSRQGWSSSALCRALPGGRGRRLRQRWPRSRSRPEQPCASCPGPRRCRSCWWPRCDARRGDADFRRARHAGRRRRLAVPAAWHAQQMGEGRKPAASCASRPS